MRSILLLALFLTACTNVSTVRSKDLWVEVEGASGIYLENDVVRATTGGHELFVKESRLWLDGRDYGPIEPGDRVRLRKSGVLLVNGERRAAR